MSQINKPMIMVLMLAAVLMTMTGCGTSNTESTFDADKNQHPEDWLPAGHMTAARNDMASCQGCHGADLKSGISGVGCTTCHMGGATTSIHLPAWSGTAILSQHGPYVRSNGFTECRNQYCHGNDLKGVANSGPSCASNTTGCHSIIP